MYLKYAGFAGVNRSQRLALPGRGLVLAFFFGLIRRGCSCGVRPFLGDRFRVRSGGCSRRGGAPLGCRGRVRSGGCTGRGRVFIGGRIQRRPLANGGPLCIVAVQCEPTDHPRPAGILAGVSISAVLPFLACLFNNSKKNRRSKIDKLL